MGAHKNNPNAIAKAAGIPPQLLGEEIYGFDFRTLIQPNRAFMDEINAAGERAKLAGEDERRAVHCASQKYNPKEHPEHFDLVVMNQVNIVRPSALVVDPNKQPMAYLLTSEHLRMPLKEVRDRADQAFAQAKSQAGQNLQ